ncbi:MAG: AAC(3) family N-acetyltransferase [Anaerolineae bacterium]
MHEAATVTQADIEAGLRQLGGLGDGDAVEVHSSLRSLGWVEGGADAVIAALMAVVGTRGAIVMSAYRVSPPLPLTEDDVAKGLSWKVRIYPPGGRERTGLGVVADAFSYRQDVVCGTGLHRVCAWGHEALEHSRGYAHLLEVDGWALLIGVGIDRCSSMHLAEESVPLPPALERYLAVPDEVAGHYPADLWAVGVEQSAADPWMKVWDEALRRGIVRHGRIGSAECSLFKARAMVSIYEDFRRDDPYGVYEVPSP